MVVSGYVLPPVGLYLMWRYRSWPLWLKIGFTALGLALWPIGTYVSSVYIMPRIF